MGPNMKSPAIVVESMMVLNGDRVVVARQRKPVSGWVALIWTSEFRRVSLMAQGVPSLLQKQYTDRRVHLMMSKVWRYDGTLRVGYVDYFVLDVRATAFDGSPRQREEICTLVLARWSRVDGHESTVQVFDA